MKTLVWVEHDNASVKDATLAVVTAALALSEEVRESFPPVSQMFWSTDKTPERPMLLLRTKV